MGNQSPELPKIKVNKYKNGEKQITLTAGFLFKLNELYLAEEGGNFFETAETDPTTAYDYLRHVISESVSQNTSCVTTNNIEVASIESDGTAVTCQLARERFLSCLLASYEGPFNVSVHLFTTPEEKDMGFGESSPIMQLYVAPPSFAS